MNDFEIKLNKQFAAILDQKVDGFDFDIWNGRIEGFTLWFADGTKLVITAGYDSNMGILDLEIEKKETT